MNMLEKIKKINKQYSVNYLVIDAGDIVIS